MANITIPVAGDEITSDWGASVAKGINGIQAGSTTVALTASVRTEFTVVFPKPFATPPIVLCNILNFQTSAANPRDPASVTATQFTGCVMPNAGGSNVVSTVTVHWIAIGTLS